MVQRDRLCVERESEIVGVPFQTQVFRMLKKRITNKKEWNGIAYPFCKNVSGKHYFIMLHSLSIFGDTNDSLLLQAVLKEDQY